MKKLTLIIIFLIGLGISEKMYAHDLDMTNNSSCAVVVYLKAVDWSSGTCNWGSAGPITVTAGATVTLSSPFPTGVTYWAQVWYCSNHSEVGDCLYMGTCAPSPCSFSNTNTLTSTCTCSTLNLTFTAAPIGVNSTLIIN